MVRILQSRAACGRSFGVALACLSALAPLPAARAERPDIEWMVGGHSFPWYWVTVSPDGTLLASGGNDSTVKIWSMEDSRLIRTLPTSNWGTTYGVAFSPDGETLAVASFGGYLSLWRVSDGAPIWNVRAAGSGWCVAFSPDGQFIAFGGGGALDSLKLYLAADGQLVRQFSGYGYETIYSVSFSPDGQLLTSGCTDRTVKLWQVSNGQLLWSKADHTNHVKVVAFSSDGQFVGSGSTDHRAFIRRVSDGEPIQVLSENGAEIWGLAFFPGSTMVAMAGSPCSLWDYTTGQRLGQMAWGGSFDLHVFDGGQRMATHDRGAYGKVYWVPDGHVERFFGEFSGTVMSAVFSPDGGTVVAGSSSNELQWRDATTGELLLSLGWDQGLRSSITSVAYAPDGLSVAIPQSRSIYVIRCSDGAILRTLEDADSITSVAFSPDGLTLASGCFNRTAKLWRVADGQTLFTLSGHTDRVSSVAFSPDGQTLATSSFDRTVKLWQTSDGQNVNTLTGHTNVVDKVIYSPDGATIASGGNDSTVRLWNASDGQLINSWNAGGRTLALAFTQSGEKLAASSFRALNIYSVPAGQLLANYTDETGSGVYTVAYSPDDQHFLYGRADATAVMARNTFANVCAGAERIRKPECEPRGKLTIRATGGRPGDSATCTLMTGETDTQTVADNGGAKFRFRRVPSGPNAASVLWGCGAEASRDFECP